MKKGLTELVFILDMSGSMFELTSDTIGGFNGMIGSQKQKEGEVLVSTVLFNDRSKVIHDRVEIGKIRAMTTEDYTAGGCTALLDAIGDAIHHIGTVYRYIRDEDVPEHTLFIITTDGCENASHRYTSDEVKKMIETREKEYNWEFIFLGANIDSVETARRYGIRAENAMDYEASSTGLGKAYAGINRAVAYHRAGRQDLDWRKEPEGK